MAAKQSAATDKALALVKLGTHTAHGAALAAGIAPSTVYRALKRGRKGSK